MYDVFVDKLKVVVVKLNIGNGLEVGVIIGLLIDVKVVVKVEEYIVDVVFKGVKVVFGGKLYVFGGIFFELIILVDVLKNVLVFKDEIFGLLVLVFCFKDEVEVIVMFNDIEFGLVFYFYVCDLVCVFCVVE